MDIDRLSELLDLAKTKRIGVWGDCFLDQWVDVDEVRVNPEADTPIYRSTRRSHCYAGGAANAAKQLKHVCAETNLCGTSFNLSPNTNLDKQGYVSTKIRYVKDGRILCRIDEDIQQQPLVPKSDGEDAWVISDYHKGTVRPMDAHDFDPGVPVVWDCKKMFDIVSHHLTLKMNRPDYNNNGRSLRGPLVMTRGQFVPLVRNLGESEFFEAPRANFDLPYPFQPSGAGDTFSGFLALFLSCGADLVEAAGYAHLAAAAAGSTGHFRAPVLRSEVLGMIDPSRRKLLEGEQLGLWLKHRCTGKVMVTNGVFDLFHAGHARLLQECRKHGDRVLVLVNTDESAYRAKGRRPKVSLDDRLDVLASLEAVDVVVPFSDATPAGLIESVSKTLGRKLDVIVKGDDSPDFPPGAEFCERVELVPCHGEHTSDIIERVRS